MNHEFWISKTNKQIRVPDSADVIFSKGQDEQRNDGNKRKIDEAFCFFFSLWAVQHPKVLGIGVAGLAVRWPRFLDGSSA